MCVCVCIHVYILSIKIIIYWKCEVNDAVVVSGASDVSGDNGNGDDDDDEDYSGIYNDGVSA